jgi:hypothetical protein
MKGLAARLKVGSGLVSAGVLKRARQMIGPEGSEGRDGLEEPADLRPVTVRPGHDLFAPLSDWAGSWNACFGLDESGLAEAGSGRIRLFGQDPFDVGWPVRWTRDPLTHQIAPDIPSADIDVWNPKTVGSIRYTWELGRQQHLVALAVGYAVSGRSEHRESIGFQIRGWVEQCPRGVGVHWTSPTETAVRLLSWTLAHGIVSLRDGETGLLGSIPGLERALYEHAAHLSETLGSGGGPDHALVTRLTALYLCTSVFDLGAEGRTWRGEANRVLQNLFEDRLGRDGLWPERGVGAQLRLLESLALAYSVGRRFREPWIENATRFLSATRTFLNTLRPQGGALPNVGEAVQGSVCRFGLRALDDTLVELDQVAAAALGEPLTGRALSEKAYWIAWLAWGMVPEMRCEPAAPRPRGAPMRMFRDAGHGVLRGDRVQVNVVAGQGSGEDFSTHGDADALSFTLAVDGAFWLVDSGSYCLDDRPDWRSYFRSTVAHNTVTVDHRNQGQGGGLIQRRRNFTVEFSDAGDTDRNAFVQAEHSGYDHLGVRHVRRVQLDLDGSSLFLLDEFFGKGEHRLESAFHLAPDVDPKLEAGGSRVTLRRPGSRTTLALNVSKGWSLVLVKGQEDPKLGWYSSQPGHKQATYCVVAKYKGRLPLRARTLIEISLGQA